MPAQIINANGKLRLTPDANQQAVREARNNRPSTAGITPNVAAALENLLLRIEDLETRLAALERTR